MHSVRQNCEVRSYEHFIKQTYRNRCHIYNSNGLLPLIIPVEHTNIATAPIRDIQIRLVNNGKKSLEINLLFPIKCGFL